MNIGWFWQILFYAFSALYFAIAIIVIFYGFKDLRNLLSKSETAE